MAKSQAVKRALERLFEQEAPPASLSAAAKRFIGSDKRAGSVVRDSRRLLRKHYRGK